MDIATIVMTIIDESQRKFELFIEEDEKRIDILQQKLKHFNNSIKHTQRCLNNLNKCVKDCILHGQIVK